ncbi:uncharacterized protein JCM15063_004318 [Sporobolomyces koalae]|uniref:uncharacterized protein n=1 Tax=Sporobolomyces koalae TaxID=500713 RepID=UPI003174A095
MPNWPAEETAHEVELASLKRAKQKLEDQLVDRDNEVRTIKRPPSRSLTLFTRPATSQAQHEAGQTAQAQEALRKKTDAFNNLKLQKDNAETALLSAEATLKERDGEIKKLTYQLEVTSVRSATVATEKVAQEKVALEKRVHQLTTELQKTQLDLERIRESRANEVDTVAPVSKIARPPSRSSIAPNDASRGRFGFHSGIPAASSSTGSRSRTSTSTSETTPQAQPSLIRPLSSASTHSSIPGPSRLPARRPSVSSSSNSSGPTVVNTSQAVAKVAQLESSLASAQDTISVLSSDLESAQSTIDKLESTLERTQDQFAKKKDELLKVENQLIALERSSKEQLEAMRDEVDDSKLEIEAVTQVARKEKQDLENQFNSFIRELEQLESELERTRGDREEFQRLHEQSTARQSQLEEALQEKEEECVELENELAFLEESHTDAMEAAQEERNELQAEIEDLKAIEAEKEAQEEDMEELQGSIEELERQLKDAAEECHHLETLLSQAQSERSPVVEFEQDNQANDSEKLEAQIAILEAELFKRTNEIDSLTNRLERHEELVSAHKSVSDEVNTLSTNLEAQSRELANVSAQLDEAHSSHAQLRQVAEEHEILAKRTQESVTQLTTERDELATQCLEHTESLATLASQIDRLDALPVRSHDDVEFAQLEARLVEIEAEAASLRQRIDESSTDEWAAEQAQQGLNERIVALETRVTELQDALDSERGSALQLGLELESARKTLDETKAQLSTVEGLLSHESRTREAAEDARDQLEANAKEDSFSQHERDDLERENNELHNQLDDARATADEERFDHLQEVSAMQLRLRDQESEIEDLQRQLTVNEALRHILGETETRLDSLGWDLKETRLAAEEQRKEAELELNTLHARFETAQEDVRRLQGELDETRHKLSDAQDALDQSQADLTNSTRDLAVPPSPLGPPSPSPTSLSFGLSPGSDASVLVLRLREERDELRQRLDFARTEADFRVKSLQKRLEESEQTKVRELSIMEVDLLDKSVALKNECDTNAKIEEALRFARTDKTRIEDELEAATKDLRIATGKVDEFEKRLREAEKVQRDHQVERESAWALEGELEAASRSAETIRAQLDSANTSNVELNSTLDSLRADLREATVELDRQHAAASEANQRIAQLEAELADARAIEQAVQSNSLADFAALCATLESDVSDLRSKLAEQTAVISERERSISLLQLNLAVRVAIEDDEDEEEKSILHESDVATSRNDDDEEEHVGDETVVAESPSSPSDLAELEQRLSEELATRLELEQQLATLEERLATASRQATASTLVLQAELDVARQAALGHKNQVTQARGTVDSLQERYGVLEIERDELVTTVESLRASLTALENAHQTDTALVDELAQNVENKTAELALAMNRIESLEATQRDTQEVSNASTAAAREQVTALESQLSDVESRLAQALLDLAASQKQAQASQTILESVQAQHDVLSNEHGRLATLAEEQRLALEHAEETKSQIISLQRQLVEAEEIAILHEQAQRRISVLEEQLAAAQENVSTGRGVDDEQVATISAQLETAHREIDSLSQSIEHERANTVAALAATDEAVRAEQDTTLKAQAAAERAAQEIQTLRQLGRASQAEAEALSIEVERLRARVDELESRELLDCLACHTISDWKTDCFTFLKDVEGIAASTEQGTAALKAEHEQKMQEALEWLEGTEKQLGSLTQSNVDKENRIEELETVLQERMEEMDEADEKLIEALKMQKKYVAQIERLKSKLATLQRDLLQARSAPPPATVPLQSSPPLSEVSSTTATKKRRAPEEFDPSSTAGGSSEPRAIVASRPVSLVLDKENPAATLRSTKRVDSVAPLKPEHHVQRPALQQVDENAVTPISSSLVNSSADGPIKPPTTGPGGTAKLNDLKAKLAAAKKRSRSGMSTTSSTATLPTA